MGPLLACLALFKHNTKTTTTFASSSTRATGQCKITHFGVSLCGEGNTKRNYNGRKIVAHVLQRTLRLARGALCTLYDPPCRYHNRKFVRGHLSVRCGFPVGARYLHTPGTRQKVQKKKHE